MEDVGIEFKMKDGSKESFDPVNGETPFFEEGEMIVINHNAGHYTLKTEDVEGHRVYKLCPNCGYETGKDGCSNFNCSLYIVY